MIRPALIESIVFDLDGTLYNSKEVAREIHEAAVGVVAESRGVSFIEGKALFLAARQRLSEQLDEEPTLTLTCNELGIETAALHQVFQDHVHPERYLDPDPILFSLLDSLCGHGELYLYTNNSLPLSRKILALLGVESLFSHLYTIEFSWNPKPDRESLKAVLENIGGPLDSFLFVGDRYHVDLAGPEAMGISTLLVKETADLLQVHKLLGIIP